MPLPDVGIKVWYVPDGAYKYQRMPDGRYCWQFKAPKGKDEEPLDDNDVYNVLKQAVANPRQGAHNKLTPLGPQVRWPATVTAVEGDWAVLDVPNPCQPGVSLSMTVPEDPKGEKPNTWHHVEKEPATPPAATTTATIRSGTAVAHNVSNEGGK